MPVCVCCLFVVVSFCLVCLFLSTWLPIYMSACLYLVRSLFDLLLLVLTLLMHSVIVGCCCLHLFGYLFCLLVCLYFGVVCLCFSVLRLNVCLFMWYYLLIYMNSVVVYVSRVCCAYVCLSACLYVCHSVCIYFVSSELPSGFIFLFSVFMYVFLCSYVLSLFSLGRYFFMSAFFLFIYVLIFFLFFFMSVFLSFFILSV